MAEGEKVGEEAEDDYESDLDDAPLPAARRRAAASDDEEEEDEGGGDSGIGSPVPSTVSYSDSDGQGGAELYDDEEELYGTDEDDECEDVYGDSGAGGGDEGGEVEMVRGLGEVTVAQEDEGKCEEEGAAAPVSVEEETAAVREVEAKKGGEPYAVPMIGPFYMHDNRFQDKENCSRGQLFGEKKIWYPKDEAVWVHDRFQEINFHDSQKGDASIMHDIDHSYLKRIKSYNGAKNFDNVLMQSRSYDVNNKGYSNCKDEAVWLHDRFYEINCHDAQHDNVQSHSYDCNAKGYNSAPNVYREKASRTCQSHWTTSRISSAQNNRSKHIEVSPNASLGKHSLETSTPTPFKSSGSHHQDPRFSQREKTRVVKFSKLFSSAVRMAHNSLTSQSYPILRNKAFVPYGEHVNSADPCGIVPIEDVPRSALHSVSASGYYRKCSESYNQDNYLDIAETANNSIYFASSPATRPYAQSRDVVYQQRAVQLPILPARKAFAQILVLSEAKGHDDMEETERIFSRDAGDNVLGVTGARGFTLGDTGSAGIPIPAKLPVMLFRGPGFPSVAMALSGLVGQRFGGNSEIGLMTWLPILTDADMVLEGRHTQSCISTNCPQLSELASPPSSPRHHSATKDSISLPSQETPGESHEIVRPQNRPRRYTEMSFAL
ncbi:hypothetical protein QOZ80_1BG0081300 [Eleusine coracana subsp. coracana]|nr:hypothetical protein QOZ80_1BG0081300 [Eleusine coracana subsp. coracana]